MNPGWDLLVNVDWNESLHAMGIPPTPSVALQKPMPSAPEQGAPKPEAAKPETITIAAATAPVPAQKMNIPPAAIAAGVLLALGTALAWRTLRRPPKAP